MATIPLSWNDPMLSGVTNSGWVSVQMAARFHIRVYRSKHMTGIINPARFGMPDGHGGRPGWRYPDELHRPNDHHDGGSGNREQDHQRTAYGQGGERHDQELHRSELRMVGHRGRELG